jgi:cytochrome P450
MEYNPLVPEVKANPYPYYAALRETAPAYYVESLDCWAISRYADVNHVLRTPKLFSSEILFTALLGEMNPVPEALCLISSDPPDHTRLRKLVNKAFTPRIVRSLRPWVQEVTRTQLDQVAGQTEFDLVTALTIPLPVIVIAEMLGVEPDRRADFKRWSNDIINAANRAYSAEDKTQIEQSITEFRAYFEDTIAERRRTPQEDLITALVRAEEENDTLTAGEVLSLTVLLLIAGNETTTNLIGNMMLALLTHPDQLAKVQADPTLIPNVVEESLRYDGPVQGIFRQATEAVEIAGTTIPAQALVFPLFASANHDAAKFPDPERFDMSRTLDGHFGFGFGLHFCLGAQLARLEAEVALEELLARYSSFSYRADEVAHTESFFLRGLTTLPLSVH